MSREIDPENLSAEDEAYIAQRENIIGVPNRRQFSKGEAPWAEGEAPVNPGDVNGAQMSYSSDLNTDGDKPHPSLTAEGGPSMPAIVTVPMTEAAAEGVTAENVEAAKAAQASGSVVGTGNYEEMNMDELRDELEKRGLKKSGSKYELIVRLRSNDELGANGDPDDKADGSETGTGDPSADGGEVQPAS